PRLFPGIDDEFDQVAGADLLLRGQLLVVIVEPPLEFLPRGRQGMPALGGLRGLFRRPRDGRRGSGRLLRRPRMSRQLRRLHEAALLRVVMDPGRFESVQIPPDAELDGGTLQSVRECGLTAVALVGLLAGAADVGLDDPLAAEAQRQPADYRAVGQTLV